MSSEKSGDNRLFQIVMVLITSVVAPLVVFFVTNAAKSTPPAATATSSIAITATAPAGDNQLATVVSPAQTTVTAPQPTATTQQPTATAPQPTATVPQPTPTNPPAQPAGVQNPSGLVPAGTTVTVDNYSLTLDPSGLSFDGSAIRVTLKIKNLAGDTRTLAFTPGAITVTDGRKIYAPLSGDKKDGCPKDALKLEKRLSINPGAGVTLTSSAEKQPTTWCQRGKDEIIPAFAGPVSKTITKLQVNINGLGPFKNFAFEVPVKH